MFLNFLGSQIEVAQSNRNDVIEMTFKLEHTEEPVIFVISLNEFLRRIRQSHLFVFRRLSSPHVVLAVHTFLSLPRNEIEREFLELFANHKKG